MLHEIAPSVFQNAFARVTPTAKDLALCYCRNDLLMTGDPRVIPTFADLPGPLAETAEYAFSIDDSRFFLVREPLSAETPPAGCQFEPLSGISHFLPKHLAFAGHTNAHLYRFRRDRAFCGRCGRPLRDSDTERAAVCDCGAVEYPKIAPAIIVAVTDGRRLLMTRSHSKTYRRYGLVAGFVEFGESFEEAVRREVLEEVGLRVRNVTYYKSQPWPFPDSAMIGFFAELDGDDRLTVQESELREAVWFPREDIPETVSSSSIAQELIEAVRCGVNERYLALGRQRPLWRPPVPEAHWSGETR